MKAILLDGTEKEFIFGQAICGYGFRSVTFDHIDAYRMKRMGVEHATGWLLHVLGQRIMRPFEKEIPENMEGENAQPKPAE